MLNPGLLAAMIPMGGGGGRKKFNRPAGPGGPLGATAGMYGRSYLGPTIPLGGGGAGGNALGQQVLDEYQRAYSEGRQANEDRYGELVRGHAGRYRSGMAMLRGAGREALEDVDRSAAQRSATESANLVGRGLAGSTILPQVRGKVEEDRIRQRRGIQEDLNRQRLATHGALSGDMLNFMERREDTGPSLDQLIQLMMQLGQSGGLGGGGPSYGGGMPTAVTVQRTPQTYEAISPYMRALEARQGRPISAFAG